MDKSCCSLEDTEAMRIALMEADKASLPVMEDVDVNPKERKNSKMRKIEEQSLGSKIWNICGTVVMLNFVGDMTPDEAMDEYIRSYTRVSY